MKEVEQMKQYAEEFKIKMVELVNAGKPRTEIVREYKMARSVLDKWVKKYNNTGSFKAKDNRTDEENELLRLKAENKQLRMENDILKQATLIFAKK